jgi:hypothetical protein
MVVDRWNGSRQWIWGFALAACVGCSSGDSGSGPADGNATAANSRSAAVDTDAGGTPHVEHYATPEETVKQFLTALKTGDQSRATSMLTVKAQQEMTRSEAALQPPGSPTAQFQVTESEILGEQQEGAHVLSVWTDAEDDGATSSHEIVWILRREPSGWGVAGFATRVFEDQPPLILNFEDPQELQRQRAAVDAEIARRNEPQTVRQAQLPTDTGLH